MRNEPLLITDTDFIRYWHARVGRFLSETVDRLEVSIVHEGDDGDPRFYRLSLVCPSVEKLAAIGIVEVSTRNPRKRVRRHAYQFECEAYIYDVTGNDKVRLKVVLHEEPAMIQPCQSYGTVCFFTPAERAACQFPHDGPLDSGARQVA